MNTRFVLRSREVLRTLVATLYALDITSTLYEVTIRVYKSTRSLEQNALWHDMVGEIAAFTGYSATDMKEHLKRELLGVEPAEVLGKTIERTRSTTSLNVAEFSDLIERTYAWAAHELGFACHTRADR